MFPLSLLLLILCASLAFSQQSRPAHRGDVSEHPAGRIPEHDAAHGADTQSAAQPSPVQGDGSGVVPATTTSATTQNKLTLDWELVNPFRFITKQEKFDEIRRAYDRLEPNEKTAYHLEQALQKIADDEVEKIRTDIRKEINCDDEQLKDKEARKKCFAPYLGWFAGLAQDHHGATCWDSRSRRFRKEGECKDYIYPKSHKVRVWIRDAHQLGGKAPQWFKGTQPLAGTEFKECADKYPRGTCIELDIEYDSSEQVGREVSARFSDGSFTIEPARVLVEDRLIVGLGDSYASGEGNPDIPAQFTKGRVDWDVIYTHRIQKAPQKDKDARVGWLDRRCRRSMYSYQFKTALQLALEEPKKAVTYVSYACSGATTDNIINKKQSPNEGFKLFKTSPQIKALRKVLENKNNKQREIDYLLLSTGGNDIEFAKFVAYVVTSRFLRKIAAPGIDEDRLKKMEGGGIRKKLLSGTDKNNGNYPRLHKVLLDEKEGIRLKGGNSKRILLTAYPNILYDENGKPCEANRREFDTPFKEDEGRKARIEQVEQYISIPLLKVQQDERLTGELGWTVVDTHLKAYTTHGFCAQSCESPLPVGEIFEMPVRENKGWKHFDPRNYKAYATRTRWIRLPVDSKLTTDQTYKFLNLSFDLFITDDRSNIMHPTAEGHAVFADENVKAIKSIR